MGVWRTFGSVGRRIRVLLPDPDVNGEIDLTGAGGDGGEHPDLPTHDTLGLATQAELDAVATAKADVHSHPYAGTSHAHAVADSTGLQAALDGKAATHSHPYEASGAVATHAGLADPHTGYRLESADHTHASTGLQGGTIAHSALTGLTTGDPHTQYALDADVTSAVSTHEAAVNPHPTYETSAEAAAKITAHEALTDPHTGYVREADANWTDLTDGGATTLHSHAGGSGAAIDAWPVGSIFISAVATNPSTLLGGGTWAAFGAGRVLISNDGGTFGTDEATGGAATHTHADHASHTHTYTQVPNHVHVQNAASAATGGLVGSTPDASSNTSVASGYSTANPTGGVATGTTNGPGAALTHDSPSNLPPYIVVHMWKRTA